MSERTWIRGIVIPGSEEIPASWSRIFALGLALTVIGAACILAASTATLATVLAFGWLLLLGAVVSLVHAFQSAVGSGFFLHLMRFLLRGVTGFLLIRYPLAGAVSMTLVLALLFVAGGLFRAIGSAALQFPRWGWGALSGMISIALGMALLLQLHALSIWFIGFAIGVDMLLDGVGVAALGLALHRLPARVP